MRESKSDGRFAETASLVIRAQKGDDKALQALFERYYEKVRPIVRARLGKSLRQKVETDDIVNTVFGEAISHLNNFDYRSEGAFIHWLSSITAGIICDKADHYSAKKRGGKRKVLDGSAAHKALALQPAPVPSPSEDASKLEAEERLYAALDLMDKDKREILILSRIQQLSYKEVGQILECSEEAARMRIVRAERILLETYTKLGGEEP